MDSSQVIYADLLKMNFQIQKGDSKLVAQREGPQLCFYEPEQTSPLGYIFIGSPTSGAIYLRNKLIGEFNASEGNYMIRPVKNGRLEFETLEGNPIDYFFTHIND